MALDWNKEITIGGPSKKASSEYPSKTTMNLAATEGRTVNLRNTILVGILLLVLVVLFAKFAVADFYGQVSQKQAELSTQKAQLAQVESKLANYDSVKAEYESYGTYVTGSSAAQVDALTVLNLVDQQIMPSARVTAINLKDNSLSLSLTNVSLDTIGNLVKTLNAQSIVSNVSVSTAANSATAASDVTATMVITLQQAQG